MWRGASTPPVPGLTSAGAVAITGGTITGITDLAVADGGTGASTAAGAAANLAYPHVIMRGGVPLIGLSSGSVAANGAISGITALPAIYPNAYCYFPANALATAIAAGWYYCTFSSTTAGVAFLDTYTSGVSAIPGSPAAVIDGRGAFTGDTGEEFMQFTIPALGINSATRWSIYTNQINNANVKTVRVRLSGTAGTIFLASAVASMARSGFIGIIQNEGATGKQFAYAVALNNSTAITGDTLGLIDTSVSTTGVISLQRATATDNIVLFPPIVEVAY